MPITRRTLNHYATALAFLWVNIAATLVMTGVIWPDALTASGSDAVRDLNIRLGDARTK